MRVERSEVWTGRALLVALMLFTVLPFISIFMTALHPSGTVPGGLDWPADPQWGNFTEAFNQAHMPALLLSSTFLVLAIVPVSLAISTMAGYAIGLLRIPGAQVLLFLFVFGLTLPFPGLVVPIYFLERAMGIYNTRLAIVLPLIALYMPFAVFWMRAHFVNMPTEISARARGICSGASTSRSRARRWCRSESSCRSGRGTSSSSPWSSSRTPMSERWPVRWERSRATTRTTSPCCAPARS
jgi:raffinose/stachyose/melibiose transport system permease protein